jgi:predicted PurR-regulated permease PerM
MNPRFLVVSWLRPQLMGYALKLHPGVIFVGLIAGLALSGLLGALLIVPLLATAKVMARFGYDRLSSLWQEQTSPAPDQEE